MGLLDRFKSKSPMADPELPDALKSLLSQGPLYERAMSQPDISKATLEEMMRQAAFGMGGLIQKPGPAMSQAAPDPDTLFGGPVWLTLTTTGGQVCMHVQMSTLASAIDFLRTLAGLGAFTQQNPVASLSISRYAQASRISTGEAPSTRRVTVTEE